MLKEHLIFFRLNFTNFFIELVGLFLRDRNVYSFLVGFSLLATKHSIALVKDTKGLNNYHRLLNFITFITLSFFTFIFFSISYKH